MTQPLTPEREAEIRWRREQYLLNHSHPSAFACCTAHASADDVPDLLAELDRLRTLLANREDDLRFLRETAIPELRRAVQGHLDSKKRWRERAEAAEVSSLNRFTATPAEVDDHLRRRLCEDTYLTYQQTIGRHAVIEAAKDVRAESHSPLGSELYRNGMAFAADHIDPTKGGGPYPAVLLCSRHDGFGPCPGAPRCTPRDDEEATS